MWLEVFIWLEDSPIGVGMRATTWLFAVIEAVHLLGLCLLGGALLVVDLRLFGLGLKHQSIAELAENTRPWLVRAIFVMLPTGILLFFSEAVKCYYNTSFWVKMSTLAVALVFTFVVRERMIRSGTLETSLQSRLLGATSLALWFTVAAAGRWIGYS